MIKILEQVIIKDKATIEKLEAKIKQLEDEVASLWLMLDENKASDIENYQEALEEAHLEVVAERMLKKESSIKA